MIVALRLNDVKDTVPVAGSTRETSRPQAEASAATRRQPATVTTALTRFEGQLIAIRFGCRFCQGSMPEAIYTCANGEGARRGSPTSSAPGDAWRTSNKLKNLRHGGLKPWICRMGCLGSGPKSGARAARKAAPKSAIKDRIWTG